MRVEGLEVSMAGPPYEDAEVCVWCRHEFDDYWCGRMEVRCFYRWWRTHWWPTCATCCYEMHGQRGWRRHLEARRYRWWYRRHADDVITFK